MHKWGKNPKPQFPLTYVMWQILLLDSPVPVLPFHPDDKGQICSRIKTSLT